MKNNTLSTQIEKATKKHTFIIAKIGKRKKTQKKTHFSKKTTINQVLGWAKPTFINRVKKRKIVSKNTIQRFVCRSEWSEVRHVDTHITILVGLRYPHSDIQEKLLYCEK